ncbi:MAG: class I SAM-dependent methyltransferase [Actinomycetota bacterium]|nr:class I SAM-dependent methyltransferase [Actinomycetota bacterium]
MSGLSFDRAADYYDATRGLPAGVSREVSQVLSSALRRRALCLEIGVGTGRVALPLAEIGINLVGVDLAPAMLDHLVANAGGTVGRGNLTSAGDDEFTATFALNAGHAAELIRSGLPHLRASGGGSVVIVSSITGMRPAPRTAYAAAKAAEIHLAATAAQELAPDGIRVNAVSPGSIMFPGGGWDTFQQEHPADFAAFVAGQFPHHRLGTLPEVADVVAFLLSARASWITGANIAIDGGQRYPSARTFD